MKAGIINRLLACLLIITVTIQSLPLNAMASAAAANNNDSSWYDNRTIKSEFQVKQEDLSALLDDLFRAAEQSDKDLIAKLCKDLQESVGHISEISLKQLADDEKSAEGIVNERIQQGFDAYRRSLLDGFEKSYTQINKIQELAQNGMFGQIMEPASLLREMLTPTIHNPIGSGLPNSRMNIAPAESRITDADPESVSPSGGLTSILSPLADQSDTPTADDLKSDGETQLSNQIIDLIKNMNAVEIYEYVRNNINYEAYYGSRKGAVATFDQLGGNDFDTAALLVGMLRYKGIPARFRTGTVELTKQQAMELTATENVNAAARALAALGIPTVSLTSKGQVVAVSIERTWAEAYIAFEDYRGVGGSTGEKYWIPLDAGFKQYESVEGLDMRASMEPNFAKHREGITKNVVFADTGFTVTPMEMVGLASDLNGIEASITQYIKGQGLEDVIYADVFGGKKIIADNSGYLSPALPYKVGKQGDAFSTIPDKYKERISISLSNESGFGNSLSYQTDFYSLYNKKITISWVPATAADQQLINNYGGIFNAPAYLISMKPQLKVNGVLVAEGISIGLGKSQQLKMQFNVPGIPVDYSNSQVTAGGIYNIGLDHGNVSANELQTISDSLEKLKETANIENVYSDEVMGEILNAAAQMYYAQVDLYSNLLAGQYGVRNGKLSSELKTGYGIGVGYLFGNPSRVFEGGLFIDADRNISSAVSVEGNSEDELNYMFASGFMSSTMEHKIFEEITGIQSVSTVKIFEVAVQRGIPLLTVTKSNADTVLPKLNVSQAVRNDIRSAVNSGRVVTVPQRELQYYDWKGVGYQIIDTATGASAFMISGGIAGGAMSVGEVLGQYITEVGAGIIIMVILQLILSLLPAALAGPVGWIFAIAGVVALLYCIYNIYTYIDRYNTTGDVYWLQQALIEISVILTLFALWGPIERALSKLFPPKPPTNPTNPTNPSNPTGNTSWYKPDGSPNPPPYDGAVPGSEVTRTMQPGEIYGRYGGTRPSSDYLTNPGANPDTLSLPPYTNPAIYEQYRVINPIPGATQSTVAPWGGSPGGGTQTKTPRPIVDLVRDGFIELIK